MYGGVAVFFTKWKPWYAPIQLPAKNWTAKRTSRQPHPTNLGLDIPLSQKIEGSCGKENALIMGGLNSMVEQKRRSFFQCECCSPQNEEECVECELSGKVREGKRGRELMLGFSRQVVILGKK